MIIISNNSLPMKIQEVQIKASRMTSLYFLHLQSPVELCETKSDVERLLQREVLFNEIVQRCL